jgi:hypothetical protein
MKKYIIYIVTALFFAGVFSSCEDMFGDFLEKAPGAELTEDQVFSNWKRTVYYHNDIYNFMRNGLARVNSSWLDAASDLGETSFVMGGVKTSINLGNYYGEGCAPEVINSWNHYYLGIRKCNIFLSAVDSVPADQGVTAAEHLLEVKRMKAEARFFRAYFYWELVLRYGPVPIITTRLSATDADLNTKERPSTVEPCVNFIIDELDAAFADLNSQKGMAVTLSGRITKEANAALKSRILLYMASPQYNTTSDAAKWQVAMDAAKNFITSYGTTFSLVQSVSSDKSLGYQYAINNPQHGGKNPEVILWRNDGPGDWWLSESPVSFGGWGGLCPSQNLVDMYDMADGTSPFAEYDETGSPVYDANGIPTVNAVSTYTEQNPYANRDPRFNRTVLFNGSMWWGQSIDTYNGGKDKPAGNGDATPTGYYNRKYHDDSQTNYLNGGTMYRNWIFIRYAEILLNYAEARNEVLAAPDAEVYNNLDLVRQRSGISKKLAVTHPDMTKEKMRNFIRKERAVELCFEEQRWWDVRRWKVAEIALSRPIYGMNIEKSGATFTYTRIKAQDRFFVPKMYLYPIPEVELWKTNMKNNPGW